MARVDRLKEEIGWLKVILGILAAIDVSLLGWLARNYTTAGAVLVRTGLAAAVAVAYAVVRVNQLAYRRIEELEDS